MIQRSPSHDNPRELILTDVRCFQGEQRGSLRPITLLVGENSTGKTTFLGCYRVLQRVLSRPHDDSLPDFNEQPFAMGSFRDIVRSKRGPDGRLDEFKLGFGVDPASDGDIPPHTLLATFREGGSAPLISSFRFEFKPESFLELQPLPDGTGVLAPNRVVETTSPLVDVMYALNFLMALAEDVRQKRRESPDPQMLAEILPPLLVRPRTARELAKVLQPVAEYLDGLFPRREAGRLEFSRLDFPRLPEPIPVAPLRSKPKRTYDPVRETASPEGEHVPMLMMRLTRADRNRWSSLREALVAFGQESGLFSDIKVKGRGGQMSDPFQLQVKVRSGPHANIMDVGYGVSQSLPILVDVVTAAESNRGGQGHPHAAGRSFLLQQPEVHLHPRGQAQLADLFVEAYKRNGSRFLIETHSDYIIDRIRISVRKRLLQPEDVSILYFEPRGNAVTIHNMTLDEDGNLQSAPAGYRDFFLKEADRLLGFGD